MSVDDIWSRRKMRTRQEAVGPNLLDKPVELSADIADAGQGLVVTNLGELTNRAEYQDALVDGVPIRGKWLTVSFHAEITEVPGQPTVRIFADTLTPIEEVVEEMETRREALARGAGDLWDLLRSNPWRRQWRPET